MATANRSATSSRRFTLLVVPVAGPIELHSSTRSILPFEIATRHHDATSSLMVRSAIARGGGLAPLGARGGPRPGGCRLRRG